MYFFQYKHINKNNIITNLKIINKLWLTLKLKHLTKR